MYDEDEELENDTESMDDEPEEETPLRLGNSNEEESEMPENDTPTPTPLNRLKRSALLHYINDAFNTTLSGASWYVIGKHVSDMSVELNPDTESIKNILDETSVIDNGYEPSFDVDTYYADPSEGDFYEALKDIVMNRKTGDDCKTLVLEVLIDKTGTTFDAWVEEAIVKPTSYGGAPGGVRIPYTVSFTGNRTKGTVTFTDKVPDFDADSD